MKLLLAAVLSLSIPVLADHHEGKGDHREHGSHEHGHGFLNIAFQGHEGKIEFKVPAESVLGFEHAPKSKEDIESSQAALTKLETDMKNIVGFDAKYKCVLTKIDLGQVFEGAGKKHSDVTANFDVKCERSLEDSTLKINVQKYLPKVKETMVAVIVNAIQTSAVVKGKTESIELK